MNVYAFYLPQFHRTSENDQWWGEGFTEWVSIKNAKPLYEGHYQPREPLNGNYYDLSDVSVMEWQGSLAREYGISGFCVYHYWFEGKQLLQKPMEQLLEHKEIDFPYFFCWANESWTNAWATNDGKPKVLMLQGYGNEEKWELHFQYLLQFFNDNRYIKRSNKPLFVIYRPERIPCLNEMLDYLDRRAKEEGFDGICFISQQFEFLLNGGNNPRFAYRIEYQPCYSDYSCISSARRRINRMEDAVIRFFRERLKIATPKVKGLRRLSYDKLWQNILQHKPLDERVLPGAFVGWDNTPRYKNKGYVIDGSDPSKFQKYFKQLIQKTKTEYKKDMIFVFAWNEWAEGGYLEPDEKYGYGYLNAIKHALQDEKD